MRKEENEQNILNYPFEDMDKKQKTKKIILEIKNKKEEKNDEKQDNIHFIRRNITELSLEEIKLKRNKYIPDDTISSIFN